MKQNPNKRKCEEDESLSFKFSLLLRVIMHSKKIDAKELAKKSGLSERQIWRIIKGSNPTLYTICTLAKALEIEPFELIYFDQTQIIKRNKKYPFELIYN